jgi:hypothetical protein
LEGPERSPHRYTEADELLAEDPEGAGVLPPEEPEEPPDASPPEPDPSDEPEPEPEEPDGLLLLLVSLLLSEGLLEAEL